MQIRTLCMQCAKERPDDRRAEKWLELNDDFLFLSTCENNHTELIYMTQTKFEILFDMGAMALLDGYTREAVTSIAASLERFYEFCIFVFLKHAGVTDDIFTRTWKHIEAQSERQLGAFLFLYVSALNEYPEYKPIEDQAKFRNGVIHKGKIPSYDEVVQYGEVVLSWIYAVLKKIRATANRSLTEAHFFFLKKTTSIARDILKKQPNAKWVGIGGPTIIDIPLADESFGVKTFNQALQELSANRTRYYRTHPPKSFIPGSHP